MAAAKKVAPATTKKPVVTKTAPKTPAPVVSVPLPEASTRGRAKKLYRTTGKSISDVSKKTPQFRALGAGLEDIESKEFDRKSFSISQLVDLSVEEGHLDMARTKNPEKQKKRIANEYTKDLLAEGLIELI
tara:strand:+ start:90 stop:482 length:393 start_codon:yes stop_codon:yes gene_type:complete